MFAEIAVRIDRDSSVVSRDVGRHGGRLPIDYPDDQACRVSHEATYQWVYAQPVSTLARE